MKLSGSDFLKYFVICAAFLSFCYHFGEMQEWFNWHAWKACVPQKGTGGSNPPLSATGSRPNEERPQSPSSLHLSPGIFDLSPNLPEAMTSPRGEGPGYNLKSLLLPDPYKILIFKPIFTYSVIYR